MDEPIVILNGPSSSGKTSTAKALQQLIPGLFHVDLDVFEEMAPQQYFESANAELNRRRFNQMRECMHTFVKALASSGHKVVVDEVVNALAMPALIRAFSGWNAWLVGVHCSSAALRERERARGDRPLGLAEHQNATIHTDVRYDIEIDTTTFAPLVCAQEIVARMWQLERPAVLGESSNDR